MPQLRDVPLEPTHQLGGFDCGVPSLNAWLAGQAMRAQVSETARTFVCLHPESNAVMAYYAIAPTEVRRDEGITGGMAGGVSVIPAYLLARLALDRRHHGQGLGADLLVAALARIVRVADQAAGRLVVVDAIDEGAAAFYRKHDFIPVANNPKRLIMKVATARAAINMYYAEVTADPSIGLVSVTLGQPDGQTGQMVTDAEGLRAVARRLEEMADNRTGDDMVDIREAFVRALGQDPFAER